MQRNPIYSRRTCYDDIPQNVLRPEMIQEIGTKVGTNRGRFLGGFLRLSAAESMSFHRVPNQVLYQAEPLPD
jgi:hypothetical protein